MKKIAIIIGAFILSYSSVVAQIKQDRKVENFTQVKACDAIKVILSIGDKESLTFEADEEIMSKLKGEVKDGQLKLHIDGNVRGERKMVAYITAKSLTPLNATGAACIELNTTYTCDKMKLEASGAGSIKAELNAKEVNAYANGAGSIKVSGTTQKLEATSTGAACLKAEGLKSETVEVTASGAGTAKVNAIQSLDANASGAGSVIYVGEPKNKTLNISSAGNINKA